MGRLRPAKHYSYLLAGVVYFVQVLGVETLLQRLGVISRLTMSWMRS
jgi:hypothetical protein